MEVKEFIYNILLERDKNIFSDPITMLTRYKILTKHFIFPCNITKKGCNCEHDYNKKKNRPMCCCINCCFNIGYLYNIRPSFKPLKDEKYDSTVYQSVKKVIKIYAKHFSINTGFWRKGRGCILPRRLRSVTCLTYVCSDIAKEFREKNGKNIVDFRRLLACYSSLTKKEKDKLFDLYKIITEELKKKGIKK